MCAPVDFFSTMDFELFVTNDLAIINEERSSESISGSISDPIIDLQMALVRADQIAAPYLNARVTIFLTPGTHHVLPLTGSFRTDILSANYHLTIQ